MTIGFRLPPAAAERVAFSYSPAMEAVLSLHVLVAGALALSRAASSASAAASSSADNPLSADLRIADDGDHGHYPASGHVHRRRQAIG